MIETTMQPTTPFKIRIATLTLMLVANSLLLFSQGYEIESRRDSLREILGTRKAIDQQTVDTYLRIGSSYGWDNPDSSIANLNKAYLLSQKLNFEYGKFSRHRP